MTLHSVEHLFEFVGFHGMINIGLNGRVEHD